MITSLAIRKFLLEELRSISTQLYLSEASRRRLLADEDRWGVGAVDEALKIIKPVEVLVTLYLAKVAPTK